jgi:phosphotransferase system enzyme I (PtsP)
MNDNVPFSPQMVIEGISLNNGIGHGRAYIYDPNFFDDSNFDISIRKELFLRAVNAAIENCSIYHIAETEENRELVLVQKALLKDPSWQQRVFSYINKGLSITIALESVLNDLEAVFNTDQFWHARFLEIRGITQLVRQNLSGKNLDFEQNIPLVLCTKTISPLELIQFSEAKIVALVVEDSSFLSHGMIIARAKRIPVVGGVQDLKSLIKQDDALLVDGDLGRIYVKPASALVNSYDNKPHAPVEAPNNKSVLLSRDDIPVNLYLNASLTEDLEYLDSPIIKGVGLYRTEIPFMLNKHWPDVATQIELYRNIFNQAKGKPVVFRTLDIGGDKIFNALSKRRNYMHAALKYDRLTLQRPSLIRLQLRAMIRAHVSSDYPNLPLSLMFPMISEVQEMRFVSSLIDIEIAREKKLGHSIPKIVRKGVMVEVPSLVFQIDAILDLVNFISIGSNDLFHFTYAIDRTDAVMSRRYDLLSKPFLQILKTIVDQAHKKEVDVSLCGEMASQPVEAMALLGIGLRNFSVNPSAINSIEKMIRSLDVWSMQDYMNDCLIDHPFSYKHNETSIRQRVLELAAIQNTQLN